MKCKALEDKTPKQKVFCAFSWNTKRNLRTKVEYIWKYKCKVPQKRGFFFNPFQQDQPFFVLDRCDNHYSLHHENLLHILYYCNHGNTSQLGKPKFDRFLSNNFPCKQNHVVSSRFFASWFQMIVKKLTQSTESRTTLYDLTEKSRLSAFWSDFFVIWQKKENVVFSNDCDL